MKEKFSFRDMLMFRTITIGIMLTFTIGFVLVKDFDAVKSAAIILLTIYMAMLAFSEVFQGNMQLNRYMSIGGRSQGCEVLLAALMFTVTLFITRKLLIACAVMAIVVFLWIIVYDLPYNRNFASNKPRFEFGIQKRLFLSTFPLFISVFLNQYTLNTPKYAIDLYLNDIAQSQYGYLLMPTFFINLLGIFAFRPQYVSLAEKLHNDGPKAFTRAIRPLYLLVVLFTVVTLAGGFLLGIPVLNLLYNTDLSGQKMILMILLTAGGFSAASSLTVALLTIIRKQKFGLIAYVTTFACAQFIPNLMVSRWGLMGASCSYLVATSMLFTLLFTTFMVCLIRLRKQGAGKEIIEE